MKGRVLGIVLLVAACGAEVAPTTTTAAVTTTAPTTTTSLVSTTTTVPVTTTSVAAIEGVPEEALALIGAPMPEVPEYPDGFDAEVWFEAYAAWNQWAFANPVEGLETLDQWVVPGSELSESLEAQLVGEIDNGWLTLGDGGLELLDFEVADELIDEGFVLVNLEARAVGSVWLLESEVVIRQESFDGSEARRSLVALEEVGGVWLLQSWD